MIPTELRKQLAAKGYFSSLTTIIICQCNRCTRGKPCDLCNRNTPACQVDICCGGGTIFCPNCAPHVENIVFKKQEAIAL